MSSPNSDPQPRAPLILPRPDAAARLPIMALLHGIRSHSAMIRESLARELEESPAYWTDSKQGVALDVTCHMACVVASAVMLACTVAEKPNTPIRWWICGYAVQRLVHVALVWLEYRRRNDTPRRDEESGGNLEYDDVNDSKDDDVGISGSSSSAAFTKRCASLNTMVSLLWAMVGFYWVVSGGDILLQDAPRIYWLAVVFLALEVFFPTCCVVLTCLTGITLYCLPCIIAILYAVAGQEGASETDLSVLPKYRFRMLSNEETSSEGGGSMIPMETSNDCSTNERVLSSEDAECRICISSYEDGAELHVLPCNHHFHNENPSPPLVGASIMLLLKP